MLETLLTPKNHQLIGQLITLLGNEKVSYLRHL